VTQTVQRDQPESYFGARNCDNCVKFFVLVSGNSFWYQFLVGVLLALNQFKREPWIPNHDERWATRMLWTIVSKAAERSRRQRPDSLCDLMVLLPTYNPITPVRISNTHVLPVSSVRDLGVYLDADLTMTAHVTATVRTCFVALWQIRSVRRSVTKDALLTLLRALVVSKVGCYSIVLAGVSLSLIDYSQYSTLSLVSCSREDGQNMWCHFSATFIGWRPRKESSSVSVFWHTIVYMAPCCRTLLRHYNGPPICLHIVIFGLPQCRLLSSRRPVILHLATEHFRWLHMRLELSAVLTASSPVTDDVQAQLESRTIRFQLYLTVLLHYQHVCL